MSATQQPASDIGEDLTRQFRKAVVAGGPLKGAQFFDVSWEDLKKAAKSYRADARFNQFAKRRVSQRALGSQPELPPKATKLEGSMQWMKRWLLWLFVIMRGRIVLSVILTLLLLILLSRPRFYVVLAKGLALGLRLVLRRSVGLLALLIDAILDEAAVSLETSLMAPPVQVSTNPSYQQGFEMQQYHPFSRWLLHAFFGMAGILIGHWLRPPRTVRPHTPVTRLNLV